MPYLARVSLNKYLHVQVCNFLVNLLYMRSLKEVQSFCYILEHEITLKAKI
jgi:hypothetical protein